MIYKGVFITGTDTDVGKTYIGRQIAAQLHESQIDVITRKPIESGCEYIDGVLHPSDASHYYDAIEKTHSLAEICPYRFEPAISPQRAARLVNQPIILIWLISSVSFSPILLKPAFLASTGI